MRLSLGRRTSSSAAAAKASLKFIPLIEARYVGAEILEEPFLSQLARFKHLQGSLRWHKSQCWKAGGRDYSAEESEPLMLSPWAGVPTRYWAHSVPHLEVVAAHSDTRGADIRPRSLIQWNVYAFQVLTPRAALVVPMWRPRPCHRL